MPDRYGCPIEVPLTVIGGRWKPVLLFYLLDRGPLRHSELRRLVPGITQKMLTQSLRDLESAGLVDRHVHDQVPPRVDYSLNDEGRRLEPVIHALCAWGLYWARRTGATVDALEPPAATGALEPPAATGALEPSAVP